ncbi:MAG TPA: M24 family metallopeptidase [Xanthobacteraceae bacterium]|jgi:Xaa-Pro aminopeptidase|nr:M24 family metallopeptidase [Xanthobacteraceae bacterium]
MNERLLNPISDAELDRRWAAVRKAMTEEGVDALIVQSNNDWLGGYVKWLTDHPATNGYPKTVVFHADDWMTVIDMGPRGGRRKLGGNDEVHRGVGEILTTPAFTSVAYTDEYQAELVVSDIKRRNCRVVGVAGGGALPHRFMTRIGRDLAPIRLIDMTDAVDWVKAIKSPEEISAIRKTAHMQDEVFARLLAKVRPGMRDTDITALAQYEGRLLGSEQGLFLGASAPLGMRSGFADRYQQGRTLRDGEHFTILIENNGPGGFYTELARTMVFGKATQQLLDGFAAMKAAQDHTLSLIKPGASCRDIAAAHDDYMRSRNFPPELRLYCHGQGYDLVERPLVRADETMTLAAGMNLAVHPGYETDGMFAVICDNYLVEANGPSECLHQTEKKVFEL